MPKVLYFGLWAKGAAIKLLLTHAGVAFTEETPGKGETKPWPELKAAHPQRGGVPWYTNDKDEVLTQSKSILRALAAEQGYVAATPWQEYESNFTMDVLDDMHAADGFIKSFFAGADLTEEMKTKSLGHIKRALDILEERFADGRKYVAGDKITSGDFELVGRDAGVFSNLTGAKNAEFAKAINEEYLKHPNVARIVN